MFRFLLILSIIAYSEAGIALPPPRLDGRIVGGREVNIEEIPYQVSLQSHSHICGGSFIGKTWVLTAAQCTGSDSDGLRIRAGSSKHASGGILIDIKKIYRHSKYGDQTFDYDFSLLELEDWNNDGIVHGVAGLPNQGEDIDDGTLLRASGWGLTLNPEESPSHLRAVEVPKVNQTVCNDSYSSYGGITDRMICAGYTAGGKGVCTGDSGGPLVHNDVLFGVVSWGHGCALPNYPGVYSRVSSVRNWIKEVSSI